MYRHELEIKLIWISNKVFQLLHTQVQALLMLASEQSIIRSAFPSKHGQRCDVDDHCRRGRLFQVGRPVEVPVGSNSQAMSFLIDLRL